MIIFAWRVRGFPTKQHAKLPASDLALASLGPLIDAGASRQKDIPGPPLTSLCQDAETIYHSTACSLALFDCGR